MYNRKFEERHGVEVKGKGVLVTYLVKDSEQDTHVKTELTETVTEKKVITSPSTPISPIN